MRNERGSVCNETRIARNETGIVRNETESVRNETRIACNETGIVRNETRSVRNTIVRAGEANTDEGEE